MNDWTLEGKTVLVTGGTGGIGKATAIGIAGLGASVVVTGRDRTRGGAAIQDIRQISGNQRVSLLISDLSTVEGAHQLARDFGAIHDALHVLINNVGLLEGERRLTADGIEASFAVNVLAPFVLTHALLEPLERAGTATGQPARVINVTGGLPARIDLSNLQAEKSFLGLQTYSRAKAAMVAMSLEFARRLAGHGVTLNVAYPGSAATEMSASMTPEFVPVWLRLLWPAFRMMTRNAKPERAAQSSIFLASSPNVSGVNGAYFDTNSRRASPPKDALKETIQRRIWQVCEELAEARGQSLEPAVRLSPA